MALHGTAIFLAAVLPLGAAAAEIRLGTMTQVSRDRKDAPHVEPFLAAHPRDPDVLVGGAIVFADSEPTTHAFVSRDRGRSWRRFPLEACRVDPWLDFDSDGSVYAACLGGREEENRIVVYRSGDGGLSWEEPAIVPPGGGGSADRPVLAVDRTSGPGRGHVVVAFGQHFPTAGLAGQVWGPAVARSVDGGKSFGDPVFVRHDNLQQQPLDAKVLADGTYVLAFMDFAESRRLLAHRRTWLIRSRKDRRTFSLPILVREQVLREMPWSMAVDGSARYPDRIYVAMDGFWEREGARPEALKGSTVAAISVIYSDDRGRNWSRPVAVSDGSTETNGENPAIAVNRGGAVAVAWYDTRNDPQGRCFDVYLSVSLDGGRSFLPNRRITPETSCPGNSDRQEGVARRWQFGGDYSGLAAGADGAFHLFWADSRTGLYQIWHRTAEVDTGERRRDSDQSAVPGS